MVDAPPEPRPSRGLSPRRLEAFSDGVFAIAITLLVLEIGLPATAEADLLQALVDAWPSYLAYIVSFATIGAAWIAHNIITEHIDRVDTWFIRLNLLLLLVVAFLPFPTRLLAEHITAQDAERVAATFFGVCLLLIALLTSVLWRYAARAGLTRPDTGDDEIRGLSERLTPGLAGYLILIVVGLVWPRAAVFGYLVVALFFLVPFRLPFREGR
jgi:uncharacterized membrane protein